MSTVYVLSLEHGKYYVGSTENLEVRIEAHSSGRGALWTKLHKPIKVIEVIRGCDEFDEDKYVKKYMHRYGIDNVRGGSYVFDRLDDTTKKFIERELLHSSKACFKCGKLGHFVKECPTQMTPSALVSNANLINLHDNEVEDIEEPEASPPPVPTPVYAVPPMILRPPATFFPETTQLLKCEKCNSVGHTSEACLVSQHCTVRVLAVETNNLKSESKPQQQQTPPSTSITNDESLHPSTSDVSTGTKPFHDEKETSEKDPIRLTTAEAYETSYTSFPSDTPPSPPSPKSSTEDKSCIIM